MDYYFYSKNPDYFGLLVNYADISKVLVKEYLAWEKFGYGPEKVFVFGFSFGAQLALELGREINRLRNGTDLISRIDGECSKERLNHLIIIPLSSQQYANPLE